MQQINRISEINKLGQSIWYDNIQRKLLESGQIADMIGQGDLQGMTSNPTIFDNAISQSQDYDLALKTMSWAGLEAEEIFYQLAIEDIRTAADLFFPIYTQTHGNDGFVSLEVSPYLAKNTRKTIDEAQRLWNLVQKPNLMVKIPATEEGIPAIQKSIAEGINVNVTLIFSKERYRKVINAFMNGLEERIKKGLPIDTITSVASFFVSRVDNKVDSRLENIIKLEKKEAAIATKLMGEIAIANSHLAYALYTEQFSSERWSKIQEHGAKKQRPLWASTSTKNPSYSDVLYIESLILPNTVNTVPNATLVALKDHAKAELVQVDAKKSQQLIDDLESIGLSMKKITDELEEEGVNSFSKSYKSLLDTIEKRRTEAEKELGIIKNHIPKRVEYLSQNKTAHRLYDHDPTLWVDNQEDKEEIVQRLGWLDAPQKSKSLLNGLNSLLDSLLEDGYTQALLLGMGGSSLAPEVLSLVFRPQGNTTSRGLDLKILDSTDPDQVKSAAEWASLNETLFVVSSKSGTTAEVNAFLNYFWELANTHLGEKAGDHFVAITDPGTSLEKTAYERNFRHVFQADPEVGGRYSALTAFGLVPASLLGLDVAQLLERATWMMEQCKSSIPYARNPGLVLGSIVAEAALNGMDKLTILTDPELNSFGSWLEQLVAESSGKEDKGIIPIDIEPLVDEKFYGNDRLFVYISSDGKKSNNVDKLLAAGHPVIQIPVADRTFITSLFYQWEIAIAIACSIIGVNAFDQPNVQDSKIRTKNKITQFKETNSLSFGESLLDNGQASIYGNKNMQFKKENSLSDVIKRFVSGAKKDDYIAINAYLPRTSENLAKLQVLREAILRFTKKATTLGFGPRFLHSTGQLHKGGPDSGHFIQITHDPSQDIEIPGENISFGIMEKAQAVGDFEALSAKGRRVINIHWKDADPSKIASEIIDK